MSEREIGNSLQIKNRISFKDYAKKYHNVELFRKIRKGEKHHQIYNMRCNLFEHYFYFIWGYDYPILIPLNNQKPAFIDSNGIILKKGFPYGLLYRQTTSKSIIIDIHKYFQAEIAYCREKGLDSFYVSIYNPRWNENTIYIREANISEEKIKIAFSSKIFINGFPLILKLTTNRSHESPIRVALLSEGNETLY